jgi:5-hydroxyisourate hydrolase-like protein (transthyretin family)
VKESNIVLCKKNENMRNKIIKNKTTKEGRIERESKKGKQKKEGLL